MSALTTSATLRMRALCRLRSSDDDDRVGAQFAMSHDMPRKQRFRPNKSRRVAAPPDVVADIKRQVAEVTGGTRALALENQLIAATAEEGDPAVVMSAMIGFAAYLCHLYGIHHTAFAERMSAILPVHVRRFATCSGMAPGAHEHRSKEDTCSDDRTGDKEHG